jgi:MoaA/NifB/PqqE/SkfB family radical SAM enzyme
MSKLCPAPWVGKFIHPNGRITPCCYTREENISELKEQFIQRQQPNSCLFCWQAESKNLHSPRQDWIEFAKDFNPNSSQDELLSINLGNYCNAECIICNGASSSKRNTWAKKNNTKEHVINAIATAEVDFNFGQYPHLRQINLIGGEPVIHPTAKRILEELIFLGMEKYITVSFNTNASKFPNQILKLIKQFKEVQVTLSIDGAGQYFEYQRRPLEWNTVKSISEQWMALSNNVMINYVVSAVSIWGFNEFIDWLNDKPAKIIFNHVTDKHYLSLSVLNDKQKEQWIESAVNHPLKQDIVNILNTVNYQADLVPLLAKHIELEDSAAKIKFAELFPNWKIHG